ncbi:MAG: undecaprenyldiphospho-muramoylpentapeptide beta-N-acetylglucosaminyltransferase [Acidimicrobiaceae bacterium]|nr:undecaprenyldiphospho-muramoylpentapeptide beta-N-acetylglucosaminyltransferase [Acidimicrobiaceae bacterium]
MSAPAPRGRGGPGERPGSSWAVIAGGGTAGHVLPGISIAEQIVAGGAPREAVHFVGSARGVETRLVTEAGFGLTALPGRGLQRRLALSNATATIGLLRAFAEALVVLRRRRPAVVLGLGGYASAACGAAAALLRVPLVITEQNAVPGLANRLLSRFAAGAATAFEATDLPRATWTGNPVRTEVLAADRTSGRAAARAALGVGSGRRLVAVFGGSLGSRSINEAVAAASEIWHDRGDLHIRHIAGRRDYDDLAGRAAPDRERALGYDLVAYEDDMATVYAAADIVVSRSGATTVAELAAAGVPAVLVPLPGAPGDHQTANARRLAEAGGAVIVSDAELDGTRLAAEVDALLDDPDRLSAMAGAATALARPDAARAVVDLIERCALRPQPREQEAAP